MASKSPLEKEVKNIITGLLTSNPSRCTIHKLCTDFAQIVGYSIPIKKLGFRSIEEYLASIPDTVQIFGRGPSAEVQGVFKPNSAHINLMVVKQKNVPTLNKKKIPKRNVLEETSAVLTEEHNSNVPKTIQNNLKKLISEFPEGIWCTEMLQEYRKMFNTNLDYQKYRYRSLIEMCSELTDIFRYTQINTDDYMLYDKNLAEPSLNQNEIFLEESPVKFDWSHGSDLYQLDIVLLGEEIPRILPRLSLGDFLDVTIGEIYSINDFWMFLTDGPIKTLLAELEEHFEENKNSYVIPKHFLEVGLYCTVYHKEKFHRGAISELYPKENCLDVLFIDYGSTEKIPRKNIWYLPKKFAELPSQSIKASLFKIKPKDDILCTQKFKNLCKNKILLAEVSKEVDKTGTVEVYLTDITNEEEIFFINDKLVDEEYASYV